MEEVEAERIESWFKLMDLGTQYHTLDMHARAPTYSFIFSVVRPVQSSPSHCILHPRFLFRDFYTSHSLVPIHHPLSIPSLVVCLYMSAVRLVIITQFCFNPIALHRKQSLLQSKFTVVSLKFKILFMSVSCLSFPSSFVSCEFFSFIFPFCYFSCAHFYSICNTSNLLLFAGSRPP